MPEQEHATTKEAKPKRRWIGISQTIAQQRHERYQRNKPQPWIAQKLAVGLVIGITGYTWYVYVGRFCAPMIRTDEDSLGGRAMGIAFLIVFCFLGLMFWWTYIKLILTPPGFARDHVKKATKPQVVPNGGFAAQSDSTDSISSDIGTPYTEMPSTPMREGVPATGGPPRPSLSRPARSSRTASGRSEQEREHPEKEKPPRREKHSRHGSHGSRVKREEHTLVSEEEKTHVRDDLEAGTGAPPPPPPQHQRKLSAQNSLGAQQSANGPPRRSHSTRTASGQEVAPAPTPLPNMFTDPKLSPLPPKEPGNRPTIPSYHPNGGNPNEWPPPMQSRRPTTLAVLAEENRWCMRCGHVKPMRTHHCRSCGTCVLMYDHHCPWIGQCVGAYNVKFFMNFLEWAPPFTGWTFATLLARNVQSNRHSFSDVQHIVIIALSAFFTFFTIMMLVGHVRFTLLNMTTVESMRIRDMKERERAILDRQSPIWHWRKRRQIENDWDREWGELYTEGNIWWLDSARANWTSRMGRNQWGWFLPIGRSDFDGLTFPMNPRFTDDGRWRRRNEWPHELQNRD